MVSVSHKTQREVSFAPNFSNSIGRPHVQTDPFRCIRGIFHDMWDRDQRGKVRGEAEVRGHVFLVLRLCCMCAGHKWSQPPAKGHRGWPVSFQAPN